MVSVFSFLISLLIAGYAADKDIAVASGGKKGEVVLSKDSFISDSIYSYQEKFESKRPEESMPENKNYIVEVYRGNSWDTLFVHSAKISDYTYNPDNGYQQYTMGFSMLTDSFTSPVKVRITNTLKKFSHVEIRPISYRIKPSIVDDNRIEFKLLKPTQKVSVEFDGDRLTNLFILPDLPDINIPEKDVNVLYYGPGIHNIGLISIKNKNNQIIYIDEGALVYGRIEAQDATNLTIRGRGILCSSQEEHGEGRPYQMSFMNCDNLRIEGIMLRDTPSWTIRIAGSKNIHIDNIKEIGWIRNSDGIDFVNCRDVLVENTFQRNYDDNVTIKAFNGKPEYVAAHTNPDGSYSDDGIWSALWLKNHDVDNYVVRNCVFWADKAHNMLVGPEARGISFTNIKFQNNIVLENRQDDSIYPGAISIMVADNGTFENIIFENIDIEDIRGGKPLCVQFANVWAFNNLYGQYARNIQLRNVRYTGSHATTSWIKGLNETQSVDGVTIHNFIVNGQTISEMNSEHLSINQFVRNITFE